MKSFRQGQHTVIILESHEDREHMRMALERGINCWESHPASLRDVLAACRAPVVDSELPARVE